MSPNHALAKQPVDQMIASSGSAMAVVICSNKHSPVYRCHCSQCSHTIKPVLWSRAGRLLDSLMESLSDVNGLNVS
jgi:hypothetical protein